MKLEIATDFIRLDALLKYAGIAMSGGEAKLRILDGQVSVNSSVCLSRGKKIFPGDLVAAGGETFVVCSGGKHGAEKA